MMPPGRNGAADSALKAQAVLTATRLLSQDVIDREVKVCRRAEMREQGIDDHPYARRKILAVRIVQDDLALTRIVHTGHQQFERSGTQVGQGVVQPGGFAYRKRSGNV